MLLKGLEMMTGIHHIFIYYISECGLDVVHGMGQTKATITTLMRRTRMGSTGRQLAAIARCTPKRGNPRQVLSETYYFRHIVHKGTWQARKQTPAVFEPGLLAVDLSFQDPINTGTSSTVELE